MLLWPELNNTLFNFSIYDKAGRITNEVSTIVWQH